MAKPAPSRLFSTRAPEPVTVMVNSIFNGWRMGDVWLDK
jgi:hypothetical protein